MTPTRNSLLTFMQSHCKSLNNGLGGCGGSPNRRKPPARLSRGLSFPMTLVMVPVRSALFPAVRHPVVASALADPAATHPNVLVSAPLPISRRPHKTYARRRHNLNANRRRCDVDINGYSRRCNRGDSYRTRGQAQPQKQGLTISVHSTLLFHVS